MLQCFEMMAGHDSFSNALISRKLFSLSAHQTQQQF
jgi:hypothetical protein